MAKKQKQTVKYELIVAVLIGIVGIGALAYGLMLNANPKKTPELFVADKVQMTSAQKACIQQCKSSLIAKLKKDKRKPTAQEQKDAYRCASECMGDDWGKPPTTTYPKGKKGGSKQRPNKTPHPRVTIDSNQVKSCLDPCVALKVAGKSSESIRCAQQCLTDFKQ